MPRNASSFDWLVLARRGHWWGEIRPSSHVDGICVFYRQQVGMLVQHKLYFRTIVVDLLRSPTHKQFRIEHVAKFGMNGSKGGIRRYAIQQIVWFALTFNDNSRFHAVDTDLFVQVLAVPSGLDA